MTRLAAVAVLAALLAGCTLGPKYKRPIVQPPANFYTAEQVQQISTADMAWWDLFKDPILQGLIHEALEHNYDLQLALAQVEQQRALLGVTRSQFYPQVAYDGNISGQQSLAVPNHTYYSYSFTTFWEIDLFGRIRKMTEAQRAVYFSSEEARRDVRLLIMAQVAQGYFTLRALDAQIEIAHRTVKSFQDTLDIFQHRLEGGYASALETSRAQAALSNVAANDSRSRAANRRPGECLGFAAGSQSRSDPRAAPLSSISTIPPTFPQVCLPRSSSVVPIFANLSRTCIAANANIGVAKANFFPTISLSGLFGGVSPQLSELTGAGKAWTLAGDFTGPIFTGGRLKNQYYAAIAQRDQARVTFEKAVTQAFGEVSTSLSAHQQLARAYREQVTSVDAYRESVRLSTIRYDSGLSSYLDIIDAQIQMYPAESQTVTYDLERKLALVDLYRALGGGWNLTDAQWTSASPTAPSSPGPTQPHP